MKNLLNAIKIYKLIIKYPGIFEVVKHIFNMLNDCAKDDLPRINKVTIDFKTDLIENVDINLWCATGSNNPIRRIQELIKENKELKLNK